VYSSVMIGLPTFRFVDRLPSSSGTFRSSLTGRWERNETDERPPMICEVTADRPCRRGSGCGTLSGTRTRDRWSGDRWRT
jgi:hypothetical protein